MTTKKNLGFGKYFSPRMVQTTWTLAKGWAPLEITDVAPIALHPAASVLQYSQTIFEGMKAFRGEDGKIRLFRADFNAARFQKSASRVCLPEVPKDIFLKATYDAVSTNRDSIPSDEGEALYLRPTLMGTEGFLGVRPSHEAMFFVICSPVGNYYEKGQSGLKILVETEDSRAALGGIGDAKAGANYAASLRAAERAKSKGFDQVLWMDSATHQWIEEVGTMNIFFRIGDTVVTPALNGSILNGATRTCVLEILRDKGIRVEERPVSIEEIFTASENGQLKEAFGTGTAAVISSVQEFALSSGGRRAVLPDNGEIATAMRKTILDIQYGRTADKFGWCTIVN